MFGRSPTKTTMFCKLVNSSCQRAPLARSSFKFLWTPTKQTRSPSLSVPLNSLPVRRVFVQKGSLFVEQRPQLARVQLRQKSGIEHTIPQLAQNDTWSRAVLTRLEDVHSTINIHRTSLLQVSRAKSFVFTFFFTCFFFSFFLNSFRDFFGGKYFDILSLSLSLSFVLNFCFVFRISGCKISFFLVTNTVKRRRKKNTLINSNDSYSFSFPHPNISVAFFHTLCSSPLWLGH
jgi:hypothetical protein